MKRTKQIDIKRALALSGTFLFLCCCARACILPFLTLYFRQLGLTPAMTGIIMGTKHLISLFWSPLGSLLSKHYNKRRGVLIGSLVCSAAVALIVLLIPSVNMETLTSHCNMSDMSESPAAGQGSHGLVSGSTPTVESTLIHPEVNSTFVSKAALQSDDTASNNTLSDTRSAPVMMNDVPPYMPKQEVLVKGTSYPEIVGIKMTVVDKNNSGVSSSFDMLQNSSVIKTSVRKIRSLAKSNAEVQQEEEVRFQFLGSLKMMDVQHQLFFLLLIIMSVWEGVSSPLQWTADDGLYEYLDFVDATDRYGSTAVWGLLGATFGVGGIGILVSRLNCLIGGQTPRSAVHFLFYAGLMALALPLAALLPLYLNKKRDRANGLLKAMNLVQRNPRALLCATTILMVGVANSAVENFLLWQMQDCGSSELHMGLTLSLALLSQTAFPLLAGKVSRLLSPGRVLVVAAGCLALQCIYYSFLWDPWAALPIQLMSCFSSGALWWAVQMHCENVATPGTERSVKRAYEGLSLDLGLGLGSFAGGFVVQRFGVVWLFRGAALCLVLWCMCLPVLQWRAPRQRRINYSRLLAADASEASDSESEQERDWLDKAMEDDKSNDKYGRRINH